ncbi:hypothetical protein BB559_003318 [Furculomyces boomerangus]|uniref:4-hydroxybenzoate polyprenyltransferase, mitochondrial n=2 Tax=Harpellales TaxID=61421 RepID=A0A2T9Y114_9FUNG|nr:hypothetical protein BB559_006718 [Furculomyces boomerangus]PVU93321.1 hypothetical protein BB559_003318 [Furculomyces boomerangus]PWA01553.1 hypothetical protein BB558_002335 [Smittium angustum]
MIRLLSINKFQKISPNLIQSLSPHLFASPFTTFAKNSHQTPKLLNPFQFQRFTLNNHLSNQYKTAFFREKHVKNTPKKVENPGLLKNQVVTISSNASVMTIPEKLHQYKLLIRLDKPIGTLLLYWPCTWSIAMATASQGIPVSNCVYMMGLFGVGAVIMRGAGCTINDMWDVEFDKKVERTLSRPLASEKISMRESLVFLGLQLSAGLAVLVQLNIPTIMLGACSLAIVVIYPLMKRFTYWPQAVLGLAFNWGALLGWTAMTGTLELAVTGPLYAAGIFWTLIYDTIYGHQDKKDDMAIGVKSTSLLFAENTKPILATFSVLTLSMLLLSGYNNGNSAIYHTIVALGGSVHLAWQLYTVDLNSPSSCWRIFKSNTWFGAIILTAIVADYFYLKSKNEKIIRNESE